MSGRQEPAAASAKSLTSAVRLDAVVFHVSTDAGVAELVDATDFCSA